jgi:hypothetical protein
MPGSAHLPQTLEGLALRGHFALENLSLTGKIG